MQGLRTPNHHLNTCPSLAIGRRCLTIFDTSVLYLIPGAGMNVCPLDASTLADPGACKACENCYRQGLLARISHCLPDVHTFAARLNPSTGDQKISLEYAI
ncbi:hypothetical protein PCASD_05111 [Puccinia coronata f. sp. avenae]|uniref:Uncharacterized protein n=1 Tax=Puccinia coronata f. sp. avenae TaxID=200324 RepID=A0A2N5VGI2_9BASI|nr:hypothetical protein PCASD_05111 [Puccinia coronata f. sp. avenae]